MNRTKELCCGVVILNYNSHKLTKSLAEKIAAMPSVDAICVVDNHSKDDFDGDFSHPKIHYIKNNKNSGYSAGNNVGLRYLIEKKRCDYVFIANPDVIFDESAITEMRDKMAENPLLALISTKRYGHNKSTIHQYFDFPTLTDSIRSCFYFTRRKLMKERFTKQNLAVDNTKGILYVDAVPGAFFGIRSEFLKKNNYIYEGIFLYGEEIILGRQAALLGYKAGVINTATYIHDHKQTRFSNRKMFWYDRKSLKRYYEMFEDFNMLQWGILNLAIVLGTIEYNIEFFIYKLIKTVYK